MFDFVSDERNEPRYNSQMLKAERITGGPIGLGSRFRAELRTRGGAMPMTIEFTEFDRPHRLGSSTHSSMMDTVGAVTFSPVSGGTLMRWSWEVRPHGVLRLLPAMVGLVGRRQERRIWRSLKHLLELEADQPVGMSTTADQLWTMGAGQLAAAITPGR